MATEILHTPAILELGPEFYDSVKAAGFPQARLRFRNQEAAREVGLEHLDDMEWLKHFAAFEPLSGNLPEPLALRYHGHQFMHYNPDLGDGRGFLFAQFLNDGKLLDLGTKGSGQTPYSRDGDGRLTLKGAFREILATEMLQSLGVDTSKTFSVVETGESLVRHDEPSPTRAAVLVRLSHGHIRIGTFQRLAFLEQRENLQKLTEYCLRHYFPDTVEKDPLLRPAAFLQAVVKRCARLAAQWMLAGFVHGVLNTDNINISGESFDYGPYRFLPTYDLGFTAAYFDRQGLYAFGRQPVQMLWNLQQLALALRFAYPSLPVEEILVGFSEEFNAQVTRLFLQRLHLKSQGPEKDAHLIAAYFQFLETSQALYEQTFFDFFGGLNSGRWQRSPQHPLYTGENFEILRNALQDFAIVEPIALSHPYFQREKPCSLLIDELEALWAPISEQDDWRGFEQKLLEIRSFRGLYKG